jgi:hypothetical protein
MDDMVRSFEVVRVRSRARDTALDRAVTEEPLEIRLHGRPSAVSCEPRARTGHDVEVIPPASSSRSAWTRSDLFRGFGPASTWA